MSFDTTSRVRDREEALFQQWRQTQAIELDQLSWLDARQREEHVKTELTKLAREQIATEEAAAVAEIARRVWASPLAKHVHAAFQAITENDRLVALRDAEIAAIQARYQPLYAHPRQHEDEYNQGRLMLLLHKVAQAGLALCSHCHWAKPDVQLVYVNGLTISGVSDCMSSAEWPAKLSMLRELCGSCRDSETQLPERSRSGMVDEGAQWRCVRPVRPLASADDEAAYEYCVDKTWKVSAGTVDWVATQTKWVHVPDDAQRIFPYRGDRPHISQRLADAWDIPPEIDLRGGVIVANDRAFMGDPIILIEPARVSQGEADSVPA